MLPRCVSIAVLFGFGITQSSKQTHTGGSMWNYEDESAWPGAKCRQGGRRQSPIDIKKEDVVTDYKSQFIKHGQLKLAGYDQVLMMGINNGHTIQFSTEGEHAIHPVLSGGPLNHEYRLEQLHFHWLSEHAVDGHKFPMEIHFVHVRSDLHVLHALNEKDGLAIISVFCVVHPELEVEDTSKTEEVMQYIPQLLNSGARVSGVLLDLTRLLPNLQSYYTYMGSLTSPECNEVVVWIILEKPLDITDTQYRMFDKIGLGVHNFRSLQPLMRQKVYSPAPDSMWSTPYLVKLVKDMYGAVAGFFTNVTSFMHKAVKKL